MKDKATVTIDGRRCLAAVIAVVMALTMFTGVTGISHAATVDGAKAVNYGFRMVRVSWSAVKIQIPQEPQEPAAPEEPVEPGDAAASPSSAAAVDPDGASDGQTDDPAAQDGGSGNNPSAPAEPADDPEGQTDDPEGQTVDPAAQDSADGNDNAPAVPADPEDPADPAGSPVIGPVTGPDAEPAAEPAANLMENSAGGQTNPDPVYDVITYKVYRATAKNGRYTLVGTTKETSFINKGLTIGKRYYYKVAAYRSSGEEYGTSAVVSVKVAKKVTANMTLLMKGNEAFNFRIAAKQKLYQYDTLQGGCANGGYAYLTLYNRRVEKCKIVKVNLSDLSIVKVSAPLPIYHGNNLTYNTKKNRIVATCCSTSKRAKNRVVLINPSTLRVSSVKNIKLTKAVKKLPKSVRKKNKGFTAIAYNEKHRCYVARLRQNGNVVILNRNLKPLRYVKLRGKKSWLLVQGIETVGNYIYDVRSFKGRHHYCMVTVHTMSGKYVGQMKFPYGTAPGKELQCLFHDGRQFYAGFYYSTSQMDDTKRNHVNRINLIQRLNNL